MADLSPLPLSLCCSFIGHYPAISHGKDTPGPLNNSLIMGRKDKGGLILLFQGRKKINEFLACF
jgi:hypothetical protein